MQVGGHRSHGACVLAGSCYVHGACVLASCRCSHRHACRSVAQVRSWWLCCARCLLNAGVL